MQLIKIIERIIEIGTNYPEYAVGSLVPFLPLIIGFYRLKYSSKSSKFILYFVIFFIVSDIPLWITTAMKIHNLLYGYTRDFMVEVILLLVYFIGLKTKIDKTILSCYLIIMLLGVFLQLFDVIGGGQYIWLYGFLLGSVSVWYFVRLLDYPKIRDIIVYPFFWFNSGILFYCFSTLLIYFFFQFTVTSDIKSKPYFLFNGILEYLTSVMFLLFAVGFWNLKKNAQIKSK